MSLTRLLDLLLALNIFFLFTGNLARAYTGISLFPFVHLGVALLTFYLCLAILFRRHRVDAATPAEVTGVQPLRIFSLLVLFFILAVLAICLTNGTPLLLGLIYSLILAEPFMFISTALLIESRRQAVLEPSLKLTPTLYYKTFRWLIFVSVLFAAYQSVMFRAFYDDVKGLFIGSGTGHHVFGGITSAIVIFAAMKFQRPQTPKLLLLLLTFGAMFVTMLTDTKQLLAIAVLILLFWLLGRTFVSSGQLLLRAGSFITVSVLAALSWLYLGQFTYQYEKFMLGIAWKSNTLADIWKHGQGDGLNLLIGFGPGQTVSKLAYLVSDYQGLFHSLGLQISQSVVTANIFQANQNYWVSSTDGGSSLFSQFFSWAGVLGDIGLLGFALYLLMIVFAMGLTRRSYTSRLLWVYFVLIGLAFMWLEEPALTVSIALLAVVAASGEVTNNGGKHERS